MIGVLVNPNARGVRRRPGLANRLRARLGRGGEVIETAGDGEVPAAIDRFLSTGCDPIAICGGDGTTLSTVTAILSRPDAPPRIALLRGGTVNTVAKNAGISGAPEQVLAGLVARLRTHQPLLETPLDTLCVNGRFGFLFATAMGARFLEAYYGGPIQGAPWATAMAVRIVASCVIQGPYAQRLFAPADVSLVADGELLPITQVRLLLASTVPDVGIGMRVMWRAGSEPGRFHFLASALSTTAMALQMDRVLTGRPLHGQPHEDRMLASLDIRFPSPTSYTLDGELFRADRIEVRAGPRLRIVRP